MLTRKLILALVMVLFTSMLACSGESKKEQVSADDEATLFKQAAQAEVGGDFLKAAELYAKIVSAFPESDNRDKALFMAGYMNSENLGKKDKALEYFNQLLKEYPESDLVDDAQFMIKAIKSGKDAITTFEETSSN